MLETGWLNRIILIVTLFHGKKQAVFIQAKLKFGRSPLL